MTTYLNLDGLLRHMDYATPAQVETEEYKYIVSWLKKKGLIK